MQGEHKPKMKFSTSSLITMLEYIATGQGERLNQSEWRERAENLLIDIKKNINKVEIKEEYKQ